MLLFKPVLRTREYARIRNKFPDPDLTELFLDKVKNIGSERMLVKKFPQYF